MRGIGRRLVCAFGLALAGSVLATALGFAFLVWQIDRLGQRDDARKVDVIVVLGARVNADGRPGSDLASRTYHAVDLWKAGYAPFIICTGGFKDEPLSAAAVCRRFAMELGVPAARVLLADGSNNTNEDAAVAAQVMTARGWRSAILVSHPLHLFRARWLFGRQGVDVLTSPTSTDTTRIDMPLRMWYDVREAAAVIITAFDGWKVIPRGWVAALQTWSYGLQ